VDATAQAIDDWLKIPPKQGSFLEIDEDAAMVGVDSLVEGLVPAEDNGRKQGATTKDIVDDAGAGATCADVRFPMFVPNRVEKINGAKA